MLPFIVQIYSSAKPRWKTKNWNFCPKTFGLKSKGERQLTHLFADIFSGKPNFFILKNINWKSNILTKYTFVCINNIFSVSLAKTFCIFRKFPCQSPFWLYILLCIKCLPQFAEYIWRKKLFFRVFLWSLSVLCDSCSFNKILSENVCLSLINKGLSLFYFMVCLNFAQLCGHICC